MDKKYHIDLLERSRNNQLSKEELIELFDWINSSEGVADYDQYLTEQLEVIDGTKTDIPKVDSNRILRRIKKKAKIKKSHTFQLSDLRKYAAILVVAILTGSVAWWMSEKFQHNNDETIFAVAKKNKGTLTLADGSEVWLNSDSKITYGRNNKRQIRLEGEAYIQVAKDKKHQFVVKTTHADIIVYGTTFNIAAYPADSAVNVSLVEGSVGIRIMGQEHITYITPGQVASFNARNNTLELHHKDLTDVSLWRNNEIVMINANIAALCYKMEAWYGVQIKLSNQPRKEHLYNMTIRNETIDEMLELINKVTPIKYHIKQKEVNIEYMTEYTR